MPVHVIPQAEFTVTLWRHDEIEDVRAAPTGERALKTAIMMLAELDELRHGDSLTVAEA